MFPGRRCSLPASLLLVALHASACAARHTGASSGQPALAVKMQIPGIADAGKVNEFLYRGAQPNEEGLEQLKRLGIDTIVDLRGLRLESSWSSVAWNGDRGK